MTIKTQHRLMALAISVSFLSSPSFAISEFWNGSKANPGKACSEDAECADTTKKDFDEYLANLDKKEANALNLRNVMAWLAVIKSANPGTGLPEVYKLGFTLMHFERMIKQHQLHNPSVTGRTLEDLDAESKLVSDLDQLLDETVADFQKPFDKNALDIVKNSVLNVAKSILEFELALVDSDCDVLVNEIETKGYTSGLKDYINTYALIPGLSKRSVEVAEIILNIKYKSEELNSATDATNTVFESVSSDIDALIKTLKGKINQYCQDQMTRDQMIKSIRESKKWYKAMKALNKNQEDLI